MAKKIKLSKISLLHYYKLVFRSILLLIGIVSYVVSRVNGKQFTFDQIGEYPIIFAALWIIFVIEMILRFFPSTLESPGCQKQFKRNYKPVEGSEVPRSKGIRTFIAAAAWFALNGVVAALNRLANHIATLEADKM